MTESVTTPDDPAMNVTLAPVVPEVIVPLVMLHVWVRSGKLGTEAVLPVELAQTDSGDVIVGGVGGEPEPTGECDTEENHTDPNRAPKFL